MSKSTNRRGFLPLLFSILFRQRSNHSTQQTNYLPIRPQPPTTGDRNAWSAYWRTQNQLWRTEPEIEIDRQKYLDERRKIMPDLKKGIYPFKDINLSRADVEWLLATHEEGRGPVDWNDESQRERKGLDLRGADLRHVDLSRLPLTRLYGGLTYDEWFYASLKQRAMAVMLMEEASLRFAHVEGAYFYEAHLEGADLREAHFEDAHFRGVHLEGAILRGAHLEEASLRDAHLEGSDLKGAFFTSGTNLRGILLGNEKFGFASLAGVRWDDVELSAVDWTQVKILGDERQARQRIWNNGEMRTATTRLEEYQTAVRANRQLAVALRNQGLNEEADRFAYRAQLLQREVWRRQHRYLKYVGLWLLWLLAGHGYRPLRSILWYLIIIFVFAMAYYTFGHLSLWPPDAFVYSLTSFHGRGFFPGLEGKHSLHDPLIMLASFEAVVGLFIEISFIATFTQRYFGK